MKPTCALRLLLAVLATGSPLFAEPAPPKKPPVPAGDRLTAIPVKGKPGYVTSPYAPERGYVDVKGMAPGTEVRCPYTQKVFLVP